jgi:hypothetical protein
VSTTVRVGQHHQDVVVVAALLHPEISTADRRRTGAIPQAGEPEEILGQRLVGADAKVPLANRFKCGPLLEVVWVEVLELQPVRKQHHANEPVGADGEAALVEGHERHLIPLGRARHGLVGGDDPLDGVGEGRKLARLDQTEELLMGDIGACPIRHHNDEVLGELKRRQWRCCGCGRTRSAKGQVREEEEADGEAKSRTSARRVV